MGAKKLRIENKVVFSSTKLESEKLNIREVWKKLWRGSANAPLGALRAIHELLFGARIVREIAPGAYEELKPHSDLINMNIKVF